MQADDQLAPSSVSCSTPRAPRTYRMESPDETESIATRLSPGRRPPPRPLNVASSSYVYASSPPRGSFLDSRASIDSATSASSGQVTPHSPMFPMSGRRWNSSVSSVSSSIGSPSFASPRITCNGGCGSVTEKCPDCTANALARNPLAGQRKSSVAYGDGITIADQDAPFLLDEDADVWPPYPFYPQQDKNWAVKA